ncbi:MAG: insulinase family protein [Candidatus Aureabacteria bacterium]|nr:insulinase family protein [Candidatus Auribacterota bacterium]
MDVDTFVFKNGASLVYHPMPNMASVSVGIWVRTGSRYEKDDTSGISHFLEHLLFKGTRSRSALQISQEIEGIGGVLNGFTSEEYTCYYVKVLKHHIGKAIDILFDMILHPLLKPRDIEKEKGIIMEELNMYLDIPSHCVEDMLSEIMWHDHPLGRRILGRPATIRSMNKPKIIQYMKRNYSSSNIVIAVAGQASLQRLKDMIVPYCSRLYPGKQAEFRSYSIRQKEPCLKLENKKIEQTHLAMGFKACSRLDPDRYKAKLLSVILGGNMSSRLFQQVREKHGLAYAINSHLNQYVDTGSFEIQTGIKNRNARQAVELIVKELKKIKKQAVLKSELQMAKEYVIGQIMLSMESTKNSMIQIGENMTTLGRVIPIQETLSQVRRVKISDIQEMAHHVFSSENVNVAMMGTCPSKKFIRDVMLNI